MSFSFLKPLHSFWRTIPRHWIGGLLLLLLLGIGLRGVNLGDRVYWVDEVATSIRVAGYTRAEVVAAVSNGRSLSPADLLHFRQLDPDRPLSDTFSALMGSPEHAPLYFLLARFWTGWLGSGAIAIRSLSVLLSVLALPVMFVLAWELFQANDSTFLDQKENTLQENKTQDKRWHERWIKRNKKILLMAAIATVGLAISPFFIAYAQEARPYSLWALVLLLSGITLLRSLRRNQWQDWLAYAGAIALCLYTSLLSVPIMVGQGIYLINLERWRVSDRVRRYALAFTLGLLAFLPWLWLIVQQWTTLQDNTTWMRSPLDLPALIGIWIYSLSILVFDVPVAPPGSLAGIAQISLSIFILGIFARSLWLLHTQTPARVWGVVWAIALPTPLVLILADLILGGQRSTAPRYLLPAHLGIWLAIAFAIVHSLSRISSELTQLGDFERRSAPLKIAQKLGFSWFMRQPRLSYRNQQQRIWQGFTVLLLSLCLISNMINLERSPRYLKSRNLHNEAIATLLNQIDDPLVLAEPSEVLDLISLSDRLNATTEIRITPSPEFPALLTNFTQPTFLFNPSADVLETLELNYLLTQVYLPERLISTELALSLWRVEAR